MLNIDATVDQVRSWVAERLPSGFTVTSVSDEFAGCYVELDGITSVRDLEQVAYALRAEMAFMPYGEDLIVMVMRQIGPDSELFGEVVIVRHEFPDALREVA